MYTDYFGLSEEPFSIAANPRFLYMSARHREALAHLLYGISSDSGFVLLTGEVGTGKTTVCRCLLEQLPPATDVAFILNPKVTVIELLSSVCDELDIDYPAQTGSVKTFVDAISRHLLASHARARSTVVIIDEAQNLSAEVLEQLRLLTNLETNERKLLRIILLGQPELETMLAQPQLRQVEQRITARYHLQPLQRDEVAAYVQHRLAIAGRRETVFSPRVLHQVYRRSGGIPRLINVICDRAMLGAYVRSRRTVNANILGQAVREVQGRKPAPRLRLPFAAAAILAAVTASAALYYVERHRPLAGAVLTPPDAAATSAPGAGSAHDTARLTAPAPGAVTAGLDPNQTAGDPAEGAPRRAPPPPAATSAWPQMPDAPLAARLASAALLRQWQLPQPDAGQDACALAAGAGLRCHEGVGNLGSLAAIDRPAVLALRDPLGRAFEATLIGLQADQATLVVAGETRRVSVAELERHWQGGYRLLWRLTPQGHVVLRPGARGSDVTWLSSNLARASAAAPADLVRDRYDATLTEAVRGFQRRHGLLADGVAGRQTLMRLNSLGAEPVPRLRDARSSG